MSLLWSYGSVVLVYVLAGVILFQIVHYAVRKGTLEALRQFRAEGGFASDEGAQGPRA